MTEPTDDEIVAWLSTDCIGERYLCFTKPKDSDQVRPLVFGDTTQQPTQPQAGPISGAKSFQTYAEANAYSKGYYAGKKAAKQAQAGAVPLTEDQRSDIATAAAGFNWTDDYVEAIDYVIDGVESLHGIKGGQHGTE